MLSSTFVLILLCWQSLANHVAEQAKFLRWTGEDIQLMADQSLQLERMAALERSSREQSEKIKLLEARVEALEQDNSTLKERYSFPFLMLVLRVVFFCAHVLLALAELKSLLLKRDELVTDLKNIMYCHADIVKKLIKIKADADKQMIGDTKQIRELSQQLADLEVVAKVVVDMVEDEGAGEKSLLECLREAP